MICIFSIFSITNKDNCNSFGKMILYKICHTLIKKICGKKIFNAQKWCKETNFGLKCTHFGAPYLKDGERFWQMPVTIFLNRSKKDVEIIFLAKWIFKHFKLKKWSYAPIFFLCIVSMQQIIVWKIWQTIIKNVDVFV